MQCTRQRESERERASSAVRTLSTHSRLAFLFERKTTECTKRDRAPLFNCHLRGTVGAKETQAKCIEAFAYKS